MTTLTVVFLSFFLVAIMFYAIVCKKKHIPLACVSCFLIATPFLLLLVGMQQTPIHVPMLFTGVILAVTWLLLDTVNILKDVFDKLKKQ